MKRDLHMHPNILKRPEQADLFINRAIELGFCEICFTDHMPFSVTGDEHDRIPFGKISRYCEAVEEKAHLFRDKISIKTGIEIDFHPTCTDEIEQVLCSGRFDYVLGSSHLNISGFGIDFKNTTQTEFAKMVLENYLCAAKSGLFSAVSHLDIYRCVFNDAKNYPLIPDGYTFTRCEPLIREIFAYLETNNIFLEINAAPLYKRFDTLGPYPEKKILELAKEYDLKYAYGSDAHTYDKLGFGYDEIKKAFLTESK